MQHGTLTLADEPLVARPSGALFWPRMSVLVAGDLHLGRSERLARQGASLLPPYETLATLERLEAEIAALEPRLVICLGDSFDDGAACVGLAAEARDRIEAMVAARDWLWVAGNHDPEATGLPGRALPEVEIGPLAFRHIAAACPPPPGRGEVSAHYHPKARLSRRGQQISRPCFLSDGRRVVLPAFGTYTGGLDARDAAFDPLFDRTAQALMLGRRITAIRRDRLG